MATENKIDTHRRLKRERGCRSSTRVGTNSENTSRLRG